MYNETPLMNSKNIVKELHEIAEGNALNTAKLSIVFGLVFAHPEYENADVDTVIGDIKARSNHALLSLAKEIHPMLCSLELARETSPGGELWHARRASPRGKQQCYKALHLSGGVVYAR